MITKRRIYIISITYSLLFFLSIVIAMMFAYNIDTGFENISFIAFSSIVIFTLAFFGAGKFSDYWSSYLHKRDLETGLTSIVNEFIQEVRKSYSIDELVASVQSILEKKGDCSVLLFDSIKEYVIYNSPSSITQDEKTFRTIIHNFSRINDAGFFFFDEDLGLLSSADNSRGFFVIFDEVKFFVFCNSTRAFSPVVFEILFEEFKKFYKRYEAIQNLKGIDELSQEWAMIAETQQSFLPKTLPIIDKLSMAVYFKPLINVSGDYYTVIEISKSKTLVLLGDVSGKGFSAALVMGIVINMVKTVGQKTSLPDLVYTIDKTIKGMHFEDKYTVLFVGLIDTANMTLSYINASVADTCILTKSPSGYKIKRLLPNCSIVGLIDIGPLEVSTIPLFWDDVLFLATDGISECTNSEGIELGSTDLYLNTLKNSAMNDPQTIINNVNSLALQYIEGKKFRDDITMLVMKVEK